MSALRQKKAPRDDGAEIESVRPESKTVVHGFSWSLVSQVVRIVSETVTFLALARLLSPSDYGVVTAAIIVLRLSYLLSQLGVSQALVQDAQPSRALVSSGLFISSAGAAASTLAVIATAGLCSKFFNSPALEPILRLMALAFMFTGIGTVPESLLVRNLKLKPVAIVEIVSQSLFFCTAIVLALAGYGAWSLAWGALVRSSVKSAVLLIISPVPSPFLATRDGIRQMVGLSRFFAWGQLVNFFAMYGDNAVVGRFLGEALLGAYGRAYQLVVAPASLFGQVLDRVLFPLMSRFQSEPKRLSSYFLQWSASLAFIVLPPSFLLAVIAPEFIRTIFGPHWDSLIQAIQILSFSQFFRTSYRISDSLLRAVGQAKLRMYLQVLYAAFVIVFALLGCRSGILGVATGVSIAIALHFFFMTRASLKALSMGWGEFLHVHLPSIYTSAILGPVSYAVATALRSAGARTPVTFLVTCGVFTAIWFAFARIMPIYFLGRETSIVMKVGWNHSPKKVKTLLAFLLPWIAESRTQSVASA